MLVLVKETVKYIKKKQAKFKANENTYNKYSKILNEKQRKKKGMKFTEMILQILLPPQTPEKYFLKNF